MISHLGLFGLCAIVFGMLPVFLWFVRSQTRLHTSSVMYALAMGAATGAEVLVLSFMTAREHTYEYINVFLGLSLVFLLTGLFLKPLMKMAKTYQLNSLPDVYNFRYRNQVFSVIVAMTQVVGLVPLLLLQFILVAHAVDFMVALHKEPTPLHHVLPACLAVCSVLCLFYTIRNGRQNQQSHGALVNISAYFSIIKLVGVLVIGGMTVYWVFGTPFNIELWLESQPYRLDIMQQSLTQDKSRSLLVMYLIAFLLAPTVFHLSIAENKKTSALKVASCVVPLYLLLLSLPILPILWATEALGVYPKYDLYLLTTGLVTAAPWLSWLAFVCLLCAVSGLLLVALTASSSIIMNHMVLPLNIINQKRVYSHLDHIQTVIAGVFISLVYGLYLWIDNQQLMSYLLQISIVLILQLFPSFISIFYWPKANVNGAVAGFISGTALCLLGLFFPEKLELYLSRLPVLNQAFQHDDLKYYLTALGSLACGVNVATLVLVSMLTQSSKNERIIASVCAQDTLSREGSHRFMFSKVNDIVQALSQTIGHELALREVNKALETLGLTEQETRPFKLRLLRYQIESNFSGLFGPIVARNIVDSHLPFEPTEDDQVINDIQYMEYELDTHKYELTGMAAEVDKLRAHYRDVINQLPIGVCSVSVGREIVMWNNCMANITGIVQETAVGAYLSSVEAPWSQLLSDFIDGDSHYQAKVPLYIGRVKCWFSLHRSVDQDTHIQTVLLEEVSAFVVLEKELQHNQRLASIGQLAAGVAHEIGNPVTGIACLAQNLTDDVDNELVHEATQAMLLQTQRISRIVQSLVNFSHAGDQEQTVSNKDTIYLHELAQEAIDLLSLQKAKHVMTNNIDPSHRILGDYQRLMQVFVNLLTNAQDAIPEAQQAPNISLSSELNTLQNSILVYVDDDGSGICEADQANIFNPFYTTKAPNKGTGFGLSIAHQIIQEHQGHIAVTSPTLGDGSGTRFTVRFQAHL